MIVKFECTVIDKSGNILDEKTFQLEGEFEKYIKTLKKNKKADIAEIRYMEDDHTTGSGQFYI